MEVKNLRQTEAGQVLAIMRMYILFDLFGYGCRLLGEIAVVGRKDDVADKLRSRCEKFADRVSIISPSVPDPGHWAEVVRAMPGARLVIEDNVSLEHTLIKVGGVPAGTTVVIAEGARMHIAEVLIDQYL